MKLIGITTFGKGNEQWIVEAIKSAYDVCDEIIVHAETFDGIDKVWDKIFDFEKKQKVKKIINYETVYRYLKHKYCEKDLYQTEDPSMSGHARTKTLALEEAIKRGANWILAFDGDMIFYNLSELRSFIENAKDNSYRFKEWMFGKNKYNCWGSQYHLNLFKAIPNLCYIGDGAICTNKTDLTEFPQTEIDTFQTAHMGCVAKNGNISTALKMARIKEGVRIPRLNRKGKYGRKLTEEEEKEEINKKINILKERWKSGYDIRKAKKGQCNSLPKVL